MNIGLRALIAVAAITVHLALTVSTPSSAQDNQEARDRGQAAGQGVLDQWGTPDAFGNRAIKPLSGTGEMQTVDGSQLFRTDVSCPGASEFMHLTVIPNSSGDIQRLSLSADTNLDGSQDVGTFIDGAFAGVCLRGLIQCEPGTMSNCRYGKWQASQSSIVLNYNDSSGQPNRIDSMGACYCFNNHCGNGLLLQNAEKIIDDIGAGIGTSMQSNNPRFAMSGKTMVDSTSAKFFAQSSECAAGSRPEQYYNNTAALEAEGQSQASDPDSTYNKVLASESARYRGTTNRACVNQRVVTTQFTDVPPTFTFGGEGGFTESCGQNCIRVHIGETQNRYQRNCHRRDSSAMVRLERPDLLTSVTLKEVYYGNSAMQIEVDGVGVYRFPTTFAWRQNTCRSNWTGGSQASPNQDETARFRGAAPGSTVTIANRAHGFNSFMHYSVWEFRYTTACELTSESIDDQCAVYDNDSSCTLDYEKVDSTETVRDGRSTGLVPLAHSQAVGQQCQVTMTRDWFRVQRQFICTSGSNSPYDQEASSERWQSIQDTFDPATGTYTDRRVVNGQVVTSSERILNLPQADEVAGCDQMCKTRRPRPGSEVSDSGPQSDRNQTGQSYDYALRECGTANQCPLEPGDELVRDCSCTSSFPEAAAAMQTIRMVSQDQVCQAN